VFGWELLPVPGRDFQEKSVWAKLPPRAQTGHNPAKHPKNRNHSKEKKNERQSPFGSTFA
jgi:hypothetical protein